MKLSSVLYAAILALGVHANANAEAEAEAEAAADPWFFPSPCYEGQPCVQYYKGKAYTIQPATPKRSAAPEPIAEWEVEIAARARPRTTFSTSTSTSPPVPPTTTTAPPTPTWVKGPDCPYNIEDWSKPPCPGVTPVGEMCYRAKQPCQRWSNGQLTCGRWLGPFFDIGMVSNFCTFP